MKNWKKIKINLGIPHELISCHTVLINDYFIEGHIPIEAIDKLLTEKPKIKGVAFSGMPSGSPVMSGFKLEKWKIYSLDNKNRVGPFIEI